MKNKYENLPLSSFGYICRTCLMSDELFLIDQVNWEGLELKDIIFKWTPLEVVHQDHLPQQMCKNCIKLMYQTYNFLYKCKNSEWALKKILTRDTEKIASEADNSETEINENTIVVQRNQNSDSENDNSCENDLSENSENELRIKEKNNFAEAIEENMNFENEKDKIYIKVMDVKSSTNQLRAQAKLSFQEKHEMRRFKKLINNGFHKCLSCEEIFPTLEKLLKHKNETHKFHFKFQCDYCISKFANQASLRDHMRIHTGEKPFQCPTCGEKFSFKGVLSRHMFIHMEEKSFKCRFCVKSFTRKHILDQHEREHTNTKLICPYCLKEFQSRLGLIKHEKHVHHIQANSAFISLSQNLYQCNVRDKILKTQQNLQEHVLLHGPHNFQCEACGKVFKSNMSLKVHIKMIHHDTEFSCHLCEKKYRQKSGLLKHLESQHGNKFVCEICSKMYVFKASLIQHMRLHRGDPTYQCTECKEVFMNRRRLETHIRVRHTGEKPFSCSFCHKCFADKTNLISHRKIHSRDMKTFECNVCEEEFSNLKSFKEHVTVTHTTV